MNSNTNENNTVIDELDEHLNKLKEQMRIIIKDIDFFSDKLKKIRGEMQKTQQQTQVNNNANMSNPKLSTKDKIDASKLLPNDSDKWFDSKDKMTAIWNQHHRNKDKIIGRDLRSGNIRSDNLKSDNLKSHDLRGDILDDANNNANLNQTANVNDLISIYRPIGFNTILATNKNATHDLRGDIPNPKTQVSVWNMPSIDPSDYLINRYIPPAEKKNK